MDQQQGDAERRSAFDMRPPPAIPLYNSKPWFMPAFIQGYRMQDRIAMSRAPPLTLSRKAAPLTFLILPSPERVETFRRIFARDLPVICP